MPRTALLALLFLCACGAEGDYPALLPLQEITGPAAEITIGPATTEALEARAEALRARGAGLRHPVLSPAERARLGG